MRFIAHDDRNGMGRHLPQNSKALQHWPHFVMRKTDARRPVRSLIDLDADSLKSSHVLCDGGERLSPSVKVVILVS